MLMIADQKEPPENRRAPPLCAKRLLHDRLLLESARDQHDQAKINGQNMYEGRATDLEATIASLCACETLSGRAS
jgi:hypothetical protein